ncbi:MAG: hypothetical protein FJY86_00765 [Candidatus Diapherotrites archaeon]|uniref:Transglutaminase-like domain-containing protein n=1 Tax=Candidatus Iainarchaeum sp. TaxID=3101447 RepID=A0A8T4C6C4_9ARCH|nr:hypothetical protein [Candidatus Diapherotrites archaeon]
MRSDNKLVFYKMLLDKYADIINQKEQRTVGEIKTLINVDDLSVQSLVAKFKPDAYHKEKDYLYTAQQVFEFITQEIHYTPNELNINFWLSPTDILANKVSDDEDLAVLTCTALCALGDDKALVYVMEMEDLRTHAVVITEINGKTLLLDPSVNHGFFKYYGDKSFVFKKYRFEGKKLKRALYRFNASTYEQFI